ncbi:uncharacterized protein C8A04DRAFT_15012 [Dichotomopilus funicola]|uniref:Rad60/SUMO-like domain-containing protein n=1 Tax=Dichotomopilus funicola TaxID=1934379 RepID=A0AAN6UX17_9PEZI|nr:hypothetical protein C8A04DRAFT_15012 [Dichotomopilus funicola]
MAQDSEVAAPTRRRFKRTVPRKPLAEAESTLGDNGDDLDFFRRSKDVFTEAEPEPEQDDVENQHTPNGRKRRKLSSTPPAKPSRSREPSTVADNSDDDDLIMDVKGKGKEVIPARKLSTPKMPSSSAHPPSTPGSSGGTPRRPGLRSSGLIPPTAAITVIDSDDSDSDNGLSTTTKKPPPSSSAPIPILSDLEDNNTDNETTATTRVPEAVAPDEFSEWVTKARALQQSPSQEAIVKVIITTRIPGLENHPLVIRRRLNQGVRLLVDVWLSKAQSITDMPAGAAAGGNNFFLTWKGNKVYRNSTLASLGASVDAKGDIVAPPGEEGYLSEGIHLEVWTEDAYEEFLKGRGQARALKLGVIGGDGVGGGNEEQGGGVAGNGEEEEELEAVATQKKKGIRMLLKAKEHEPVKLTARDETSVAILAEAFRTQRDIGAEWEVTVWFDGEKLEEDTVVGDLDVDPDEANQLEVHVKRR